MWTLSSTPSPGRARPTEFNRRRARLAAVAAGLLFGLVGPAAAQHVVFDPRNHLENALQAARQLESLANEARSLAASPYSHLGETDRTLQDIQALARSAQGLAADIDALERQLATLYPDDFDGLDLEALTAGGAARADTARRTAGDLARTAAELERLAEGRAGRLEGALSASGAATGQTAAIQSSNQLLAVLAEDLAALRALMLAQARLASEAAARQAADQASGDAARRLRWSRSAPPPTAPRFNPFPRARE